MATDHPNRSRDRTARGGRTAWVEAHLERGARYAATIEAELWLIALGAMILDLTLTYYGLRNGLVEMNPIARGALEFYGFGALGGLKLLAVGVALAGRALLPRRFKAFVPIWLAVPWVPAVFVNAFAIAVHV